MGRTGKLILGLIFFIIGVFIAYESYANNLIDLILVLGIIITFIGIVFIVMYLIDSSADQTRALFKEYIEKKSNLNLSELNISGQKSEDSQEINRPLKIRKEFNDYDDEYYEEDMIYVQHDDEVEERDHSTILKPRKIEEETNFGDSLEFTPNYDKPIKITRTPKKRKKSFFDDEFPPFEVVEDKSDSIKQALSEEPKDITPNLNPPKEQPSKDIKIDINNPESLPIPKMLNSCIIANNEVITTDVAFEKLAENIKKEVMLEIPSLHDLSDRLLSHIPKSYSRVIIEDFDVSDMAYMILIVSLIKQGVRIKTLSNVNTINFIVDDSSAMILSNGRKTNDLEYGAIYNDRSALSEIRASFEKSWLLANDLDQDTVLKFMEVEA